MNPLYHANANRQKYGGKVEDYLPIHNWMDASKVAIADARHRILRHHSFGIFEAEQVFGQHIVNSDGRKVPVRIIAEEHVRQDCGGRIPSLQDWVHNIRMQPWMNKGYNTITERVMTSRDDHTFEEEAINANQG
ncbi:MAG: hypothetical protein VXZ72_03935 [Chlamydiota bacterium]|nr:hypothetical protein [Chlamydiota bacterium]